MRATITNTSTVSKGVSCIGGQEFIEPGQTRTLDVRDDYVERLVKAPCFDVELAPKAEPAKARRNR